MIVHIKIMSQGLEDDFDSNSDDDLNNDVDYDKYGNKKNPLFNPQTDMRNPILIKGLVFSRRDILKDAIKQYGRINRVVTKLTRNDKLRVKAVCVPSCPWTLWASKLNPKDPMDGSWQIKTLVNHHKCGKRLYICLEACKSGWLTGCRRIIGLDGCWLKGYYGGNLVAAVGVDANNCIYPVAFAVVNSENKQSWFWFLELLQRDLEIDNSYNICFMSDKQKKVAKATFPRQFEEAMSEIRSLSESDEAWLHDKDPRTWSRAHFSIRCQSDLLLNNNSEYFNKIILEARDKLILTMLEIIRRKVMTRLVFMREVAEKYPGPLCPRIQKKLSEIVSQSNNPMQWEHVRDMEPILPPIIRRPTGRPKQTRMKEVDEVRKSGPKLSKTRQQASYTKCGKPGHNTRTFKGIVGANQMASQSSSLQILNQATSMDNTSSQPPLTQQSSNLTTNFRAKLPFKRKSVL
ncbi:hypothetical protein PVK06_044025 [Gossypium arboreum]|uniref:MULE transposase domain-containing protein n=1 Tax=Gossypium arboreum TaxID=29729 RepID=A0ABR0MQ02_GOSAR|nr:hypothetical protein PVK06_044025 [Gossypium arboreum]